MASPSELLLVVGLITPLPDKALGAILCAGALFRASRLCLRLGAGKVADRRSTRGPGLFLIVLSPAPLLLFGFLV